MERLKLGVVGIGMMGAVHIEANQRNALAEIVAIAEPDQERLDLAKARYNIPAAYRDYEEMFAKERLDGAIVCTPDDYHLGPVQAAAASGAHVLLEKPIATTVADGQAIIEACETAGVKLMMGFILRFTAPYIVLRQRLQAGELGKPTMVFASRACTKAEARRVGGRCNVNQYLSVHDIDTILWNFGAGVESVYCVRGDHLLKEELKTADYYWTTIRYRNGFTAVTHSHWALPEASPNYVACQMLVTGTDGSAHLELTGQHLNVVTDKKFETPDVTFAFSVPGGSQAFRNEDEHFCESIRSGNEPLVTGKDGLNALKIILAAEESARSGQVVPLNLD